MEIKIDLKMKNHGNIAAPAYLKSSQHTENASGRVADPENSYANKTVINYKTVKIIPRSDSQTKLELINDKLEPAKQLPVR